MLNTCLYHVLSYFLGNRKIFQNYLNFILANTLSMKHKRYIYQVRLFSFLHGQNCLFYNPLLQKIMYFQRWEFFHCTVRSLLTCLQIDFEQIQSITIGNNAFANTEKLFLNSMNDSQITIIDLCNLESINIGKGSFFDTQSVSLLSMNSFCIDRYRS